MEKKESSLIYVWGCENVHLLGLGASGRYVNVKCFEKLSMDGNKLLYLNQSEFRSWNKRNKIETIYKSYLSSFSLLLSPKIKSIEADLTRYR
jgi:hypothetical protein